MQKTLEKKKTEKLCFFAIVSPLVIVFLLTVLNLYIRMTTQIHTLQAAL